MFHFPLPLGLDQLSLRGLELAKFRETSPMAIQGIAPAELVSSTPTIVAVALLALGVALSVVAHRQMNRHDITAIGLISPRGKHVFGLVMIFIGILAFLSQFLTRA